MDFVPPNLLTSKAGVRMMYIVLLQFAMFRAAGDWRCWSPIVCGMSAVRRYASRLEDESMYAD